MADTKISALTASTTPLAGTEVLPIVQGGVTRQVSVANLTAGRAVSATELTLTTGNLIVSNGKGIDFSATPGTGTSELLADYEEGTWAPSVTAGTGTITSYTSSGTYTKVGRQVTLLGEITITNAGTGLTFLNVAGLPFGISGTFLSGAGREIQSAGQQCSVSYTSGSVFNFNHYNNNNIVITGYRFSFVTVYFV